ncbi:MAG: hypothetical protein U5M53_02405 [Rhodoferax sp.]|nr:hypothetical protein [Rhodoferax sp.]
MGAKTWMIVYADGDARSLLANAPAMDRVATTKLAEALFPKDKLEPLKDGSLMWTSPPDDELHIGCFPGVSVIAAKEFGADHPSKLPDAFIARAQSGTLFLHAMHSAVDWFAFAVWRDGKLVRSLSLSPDSGVIEDIGERLPFELPYWAGEHSAMDPDDEDDNDAPYPFPFHPLELGEAALREFFGYQLEGYMDASLLDPETVALARFKRKRSWLKFW